MLSASFHASQEGPLPLEEQFDIQDETSQKTLENLVSNNAWPTTQRCVQRLLTRTQNMTPLPLNTPQSQTHQLPRLPTEGSQDSVGMSKFINFDGQGAEEEELKMLSPVHTVPWYGSRRAMIDKVGLHSLLVENITRQVDMVNR